HRRSKVVSRRPLELGQDLAEVVPSKMAVARADCRSEAFAVGVVEAGQALLPGRGGRRAVHDLDSVDRLLLDQAGKHARQAAGDIGRHEGVRNYSQATLGVDGIDS